jgi:hypothetical protein
MNRGTSVFSQITQRRQNSDLDCYGAIAEKRFALDHSLYTIFQILSTTLFEKTPVPIVFQRYNDEISNRASSNQLTLFEI